MKVTLKNGAALAAILLILGCFVLASCGDSEDIYDAQTYTGLWYSCDADGVIDTEPTTLTISVSTNAEGAIYTIASSSGGDNKSYAQLSGNQLVAGTTYYYYNYGNELLVKSDNSSSPDAYFKKK